MEDEEMDELEDFDMLENDTILNLFNDDKKGDNEYGKKQREYDKDFGLFDED